MATFEERLAAIEHEQAELKQEHAHLKQENDDLKQKIELHTIAIGALVNKAALERLNERYDKLFESLATHDQFTNMQLGELRTQQIELDGKIVGVQTEVRQGFEVVNTRFEALEQNINNRFEEQKQSINNRFEEQERKLGQLETTLGEHTSLLTQILARLPEKP